MKKTIVLFAILLIVSFLGCRKNVDQQIENDITTTLDTIISGNQSGEAYVYSVDTFEQIIADDDIAEKMADKISYKISKTDLKSQIPFQNLPLSNSQKMQQQNL